MVCSATAVLLTQYADGVDVTVEAGNGDAPATVSGTATVNAQVQGTEAVVVPPTSEREESVPGEEAGPAEESGPGNEARPGRIVFVNDAGRIGTVGPDGDQRRFITGEDDGIYLFPAWSPDGSSFAALGVQQSGSGVYVMDDEAESVITEIYFSHSGAPIYLFWRPAGDAISYIASGETALNLYLSSADGAGEPQLLVEGQPLYWDWVGDESRLLVHTGTPLGDSRLAFVDVAGEPDVSPNLSDAGYFQAPAISTGGSNVAFAELDDDAERWLAVQNVNSNEVQRTAHEGVVAMGWSPVEQLLAYISPDDPVRRFSLNYYGPLRVFDAGTGDIRVLTDETVLAFFWSPDGQTIAYFTVAPGVGEQIAEHPQGLVAPVRGKVHAQNEDFRLSLSLVDIGSGQPQRLVDFRPTELFLTQFLPYFDQYAHSHRLWSPDSQALVLPMMNEDQARIYVVPASGRGLSPVADGGVAFWSPR
jgi:TolB protein